MFPLTLPALIFCAYPKVFLAICEQALLKSEYVLSKLAKNILQNKIFFLPTDPNILEHVSGNTGIVFLGLSTQYIHISINGYMNQPSMTRRSKFLKDLCLIIGWIPLFAMTSITWSLYLFLTGHWVVYPGMSIDFEVAGENWKVAGKLMRPYATPSALYSQCSRPPEALG